MNGLSLSPQVFTILAGLVDEQAGLHYQPSDLELFEQKVAPVVMEAGHESFLDYYYFLRYDPDGPRALQTLIEALTVHETYFFREYDALKALAEAHLLPLVKKTGRARVWCAACATGEEPLSLAMLLARANIGEHVEIVATDISHVALERASRGDFNRRSVRWMPPGFLGTYLHQDGERFIVQPEVRARVEYKQVNLVDSEGIKTLGQFDAVLCRNVLIYFKDETALKVVESLTAALSPDGILVVGTSESLLRFGTSLSCNEMAGAFFYGRTPA